MSHTKLTASILSHTNLFALLNVAGLAAHHRCREAADVGHSAVRHHGRDQRSCMGLTCCRSSSLAGLQLSPHLRWPSRTLMY
eukprot:363133-Chlamydomonas_euryale.AAC.5